VHPLSSMYTRAALHKSGLVFGARVQGSSRTKVDSGTSQSKSETTVNLKTVDGDLRCCVQAGGPGAEGVPDRRRSLSDTHTHTLSLSLTHSLSLSHTLSPTHTPSLTQAGGPGEEGVPDRRRSRRDVRRHSPQGLEESESLLNL